MTHCERVIAALEYGGPCCDACLGDRTGIRPHQAVNGAANRLKKEGRVDRIERACPSCKKWKRVNSLVSRPSDPRPEAQERTAQSAKDGTAEPDKPWHWEGNVQARIVSHLVECGHAVRAVADTASRTAGKDIETKAPDGKTLWVSVKGFPERNPHVQARHWFSHAMFDMVLYRHENRAAELAIGLPSGFATYENLSKRIEWFKAVVPFRIFWVHQDGQVEVE
ncbi:MAG: hypothetical protein OXG79_08930 [Chloroflexi bacterium]|nr:hypothetical protein [Chloroflexota bacterium]